MPQIKTAQVHDTADVRAAAAAAMPEGTIDTKQWWKQRNLRNLNLLLVFPLLSIFTLGYA